jgi:hypothetical protein
MEQGVTVPLDGINTYALRIRQYAHAPYRPLPHGVIKIKVLLQKIVCHISVC